MSKTLRARTHTSIACESCKKRRRKCSGEPAPCQPCLHFGTECVFELLNDKRRKSALLQASNESRICAAVLNHILESLQEDSSSEIGSIIAMARRGVTSKQITQSIYQRLQQSDDKKETGAVESLQSIPSPLSQDMGDTSSSGEWPEKEYDKFEVLSDVEIKKTPGQSPASQIFQALQDAAATSGTIRTADSDPEPIICGQSGLGIDSRTSVAREVSGPILANGFIRSARLSFDSYTSPRTIMPIYL
jgi:hypothetical protein